MTKLTATAEAAQQKFINAVEANDALLHALRIQINPKSVTLTSFDDHAVSAAVTLAHRAGLSATTFVIRSFGGVSKFAVRVR
jgi:hypothetical protein